MKIKCNTLFNWVVATSVRTRKKKYEMKYIVYIVHSTATIIVVYLDVVHHNMSLIQYDNNFLDLNHVAINLFTCCGLH